MPVAHHIKAIRIFSKHVSYALVRLSEVKILFTVELTIDSVLFIDKSTPNGMEGTILILEKFIIH